jgi:multidrug efflux pump subunit AcrA (membrane-fusion protein)
MASHRRQTVARLRQFMSGHPMKCTSAAIGFAIGFAVAASQPDGALAQSDDAAGAVVVVVRATSGCFSDTLRVSGVVVPRRMAVVNVPDDGYRITEVSAAEGSQVTAGQVLAQLTRSSQGGGQAGGASGGSRPGPTNLTLRAPLRGLITRSTAKIGAMASPQSEPLFQILVGNELELQVEVPSIHVPKLQAGEPVRISIDGGVELPGRIRLVAPDVDEKTQLGRARLSVAADSSLRIGMFGRAVIDASRSCGVRIPRAAVDYRAEGATVQLVRGRVIEDRRVVVGLLSEDSAEIREGVKEGDVVVAHAGTSLYDGDKVKPMMVGDIEQTRGIR